MSDSRSFGRLGALMAQRSSGFTDALVVFGLATFALGYETGSVLAGEPLELLWLVPVLLGCSSALVALAGEDEG